MIFGYTILALMFLVFSAVIAESIIRDVEKEKLRMNRNYGELIKSAGKAMLEKLMENSHKCGFDDIPIVYAIERAEGELEELYGAHDEYLFSKNQYNQNPHSKDSKERLLKAVKEMRREAADASNFPAMIILKCDKMIAELEG